MRIRIIEHDFNTRSGRRTQRVVAERLVPDELLEILGPSGTSTERSLNRLVGLAKRGTVMEPGKSAAGLIEFALQKRLTWSYRSRKLKGWRRLLHP